MVGSSTSPAMLLLVGKAFIKAKGRLLISIVST